MLKISIYSSTILIQSFLGAKFLARATGFKGFGKIMAGIFLSVTRSTFSYPLKRIFIWLFGNGFIRSRIIFPFIGFPAIIYYYSS